jgi:hypothetical protein
MASQGPERGSRQHTSIQEGESSVRLPTGNVIDELSVDGESYTVSIVDATNVTVFLHAESLGLEGTESPTEIEEESGLLDRFERIRGAARAELDLIDDPKAAAEAADDAVCCRRFLTSGIREDIRFDDNRVRRRCRSQDGLDWPAASRLRDDRSDVSHCGDPYSRDDPGGRLQRGWGRPSDRASERDDSDRGRYGHEVYRGYPKCIDRTNGETPDEWDRVRTGTGSSRSIDRDRESARSISLRWEVDQPFQEYISSFLCDVDLWTLSKR